MCLASYTMQVSLTVNDLLLHIPVFYVFWQVGLPAFSLSLSLPVVSVYLIPTLSLSHTHMHTYSHLVQLPSPIRQGTLSVARV